MPLIIIFVLIVVVSLAGAFGISVFGMPDAILWLQRDSAARLEPDEQKRTLEKLLPYAALSELAYDKSEKSKTAKQVEKEWKLESFVSDGKADRVGLQYKIFLNTDTKTLALVFGGTQEMHDWYSNTAPLLRSTLNRVIWRDDGDQPYWMGWVRGVFDITEDVFGDRVEFLRTQYSADEPLARLREVIVDIQTDFTIVLAGHSLGGGLAQAFYYRLLCKEPDLSKKIKAVYVFNSSPVTEASKYRECIQEKVDFSAPINSLENFGDALAIGRLGKKIINSMIQFDVPRINKVVCVLEPEEDNHSIKEMVQKLDSRKDDVDLFCWRDGG